MPWTIWMSKAVMLTELVIQDMAPASEDRECS